MSEVAARREAAVVGALVADAAAQPLHWVYDEGKLRSIIGEKEEVEFWEPSQNPFYRIAVGLHTCYGDQAYVILKSLVENKGVNVQALKQATYSFFGPQSAYEDPENAKNAVAKENKVNVKPTLPIHRPWRHASIKDFLSNMEAGKEEPGSETDDQIDCVVRMVPVCALYAGHPDMLSYVEQVLRVTQNNDLPVSIGLGAARILEQFILHGQSANAVDTVLSDLRSSQHLPESFQSGLHGAITSVGYKEGIRSTIKIGGCNASRSGFIGACMAAKFGLESIPGDWKQKTKSYPEILELASQLTKIVP